MLVNATSLFVAASGTLPNYRSHDHHDMNHFVHEEPMRSDSEELIGHIQREKYNTQQKLADSMQEEVKTQREMRILLQKLKNLADGKEHKAHDHGHIAAHNAFPHSRAQHPVHHVHPRMAAQPGATRMTMNPPNPRMQAPRYPQQYTMGHPPYPGQPAFMQGGQAPAPAHEAWINSNPGILALIAVVAFFVFAGLAWALVCFCDRQVDKGDNSFFLQALEEISPSQNMSDLVTEGTKVVSKVHQSLADRAKKAKNEIVRFLNKSKVGETVFNAMDSSTVLRQFRPHATGTIQNQDGSVMEVVEES